MYVTRCLALVAVLVGAVAGCQHDSRAAAPPSTPRDEAWLSPAEVASAKIRTEPLTEKAVGGQVLASGRVTFDDLRVSHVFSPVTGRIVRIAAHPGERVKAGQLLAVITSPDLGQAFSDRAKAVADLEAAERDQRRQKELYRAHAASQRDFEAADSNWQKAKAELARAEKKARLLRSGGVDEVTQEYRLVSPIAGEVIMRAVSPGMEVVGQYAQGGAAELFTIGETDRVWVLADVFQLDLGRVSLGAAVAVRPIGGDPRALSGTVDWISGQLDPTTRTARVRCTLPNPDHHLRPEMYVSVNIATRERQALAIPHSAVLRLGEQTVAFVEVGTSANGLTRFERRPISVDQEEGGDWVPLQHGAVAGERIVTEGALLLAGLCERRDE